MEWYWIVLMIIGYIILIVLTAALFNKYSTDMGKEECIMCGLVWPLVIIFYIFAIPVCGFIQFIEWVAEKWEDWEKKPKK